MGGPPLLELHVRYIYMYPIEVHPRPDEAKSEITVHPEKKENKAVQTFIRGGYTFSTPKGLAAEV